MSPVVTAGPGQTVEEVKRTRILNGSDPDAEKFPSDSIEYMETLTPEQWQKGDHTVYLYRVEPPLYKTDRNSFGYVDKFATPITLELIQRDYGGGLWRIVIKRGPERVCAREYPVSGPPMDLTRMNVAPGARPNGAAPYNGTAGTSPADANQSKLIDAATNTEAQKAQVDMVKDTAKEMISLARQNAPQQMSVKEILELTKELRSDGGGSLWNNPVIVALLTTLVSKFADRLFQDPTANFVQILELAQKFNGQNANVVGDWKLAAAQAVPKVAESLADALHEMRMGAEVQAGVRTAQSETVMRAGPAPNTQPPPAAANPPADGGKSKVIEMQPPAPQGDPMELFETKFVELLANPQVSGAQAAETLWHDWPQILTEIASFPPELIIANAFKRPILAPHAGNPRIPQFVGDLIAWVKAQLQNPKGA